MVEASIKVVGDDVILRFTHKNGEFAEIPLTKAEAVKIAHRLIVAAQTGLGTGAYQAFEVEDKQD